MSDLELKLKALVIDTLNLEEVTIEDIDSDEVLFGGELGLDSIDALELGVAIKKHFDVMLDSDSEETKEHFRSIRTLAQFIQSQQGER
ncbi:phosphopantetheine-binding protein [Fangia hongkongensis]|uniref:phosphopantetheine-binding protein n=1 Tax=Fangia hongkongensis TaxID=270495 RepID=UPI00035C87AA|nr:phosphopantetheine-binding protein [Fangia hongkongensis]MBK2124792.1 acyl carrier protein [Fangia hongkongensis]